MNIDRNKKEIVVSFTLFALTVIMLAAMASYTPYDIRFETSAVNLHIRNYVGIAGAYLAWSIFKIMGHAGFFIPLLCFIWAIGLLAGRLEQRPIFRFFSVMLLFSAGAAFFSLTAGNDYVLAVHRGGVTGLFLSNFLAGYFGRIGGYIISVSLTILALMAATEFLLIPLTSFIFVHAWGLFGRMRRNRAEKRELSRRKKELKGPPRLRPAVKIERDKRQEERNKERERPVLPKIARSEPKRAPMPIVKRPLKITPRVVGDYKLPTIDLLDLPPHGSENLFNEDVESSAKILEDTLCDFNIDAKVVNVSKGPVITRYELQPAPGVKVNKITSLNDDIALAMKASTVRIEAPIPGKSAVGIEVPNQTTSLVYLRELLGSREYQKKAASSKLAVALGKDISGRSVVADLGVMPHLLIAGTTGSGKTVCVNSLIMSMIYNATCDELKFIMVDPKMVELAIYNGLPHLLCPVVTDSKKASGVLDWVVNEMEERYKILAKAGTRNIDAFNKKIAAQSSDAAGIERMPYIIVMIDELADLMIVAQQEVENAITRLAQLSRAVGIHIVLATQRPSVDVVTGVIKANFPARISFKVASKVDSRTVLDMNGADKLLGKGDMLFLRPGGAKPIRAQGSLLTDSEIERVVGMVKSQREPNYNDEILEQQKKSISGKAGAGKDEFFDEAVKMVLETGQASVSMLQRRLRLGYTRAARLIDAMEEEGIVGSFRGSKPREILIGEYKGKGDSIAPGGGPE